MRVTALAAVAAVALAGCVGGSAPPSSPGSSAPSSSAVALPASPSGIPQGSVLTATRTLGDPRITLAPPGGVVPAVSSGAAYQLCLKGVAGCLPGPPTEIVLALLTDTGYGTTSSGGVDTLPLKDTLVWAISWIGSTGCVFSGGGAAGPPGATPQQTVAQSQPLCDSISFVNATTGAFIYNVAYAHQ